MLALSHILLISASRVARITGMSRQHPAPNFSVLTKLVSRCVL
jgi:hypothetical protein